MRRSLAAALMLAVLLAGCGGSGGSSKPSPACAAKADMIRRVESLKSNFFNPQSAAERAQTLQAVQADVQVIRQQQTAVTDQQKAEMENAVTSFASQVSSVASDLLSGGNTAQAQAKVSAAIDQFVAAMKRDFGPTDCPS